MESSGFKNNGIRTEKSSIEELKKTLYSRTQEPRPLHRGRLHDVQQNVKTSWDDQSQVNVEREEQFDAQNTELAQGGYGMVSSGMSIATKILIVSLIFFLGAMGFGGYMLFKGSNVVSAHNVDISVIGPVSVSGGEPFDYTVQVINNNNVQLSTVDYSVEYPSGAVDPTNLNLELKGGRMILPNIAPGSKTERSEKAIMYGAEGEKKEIKLKVLYRVPNSSATYEKETVYAVLINSAPISVKIDSFTEINSNQEIEFTATLNSNSKETLKNLLFKVDYPFGFVFTSSDPKPLYDNQTWQVGDINPGGKKIIKIRGKLQGQDDEERSFKFHLGLAASKGDRAISAEFVKVAQVVKIKKPFISLNLKFNGDSSTGDYSTTFNQTLRGEVQWFNNLTTAVEDAEIHLKLNGNAYDKTTVTPDGGTFLSGQDEIVWNQKNIKELAKLGPGESGRVTFSIVPKDTTRGKGITNPQISFEVSVKGDRPSESNVPEKVVSGLTRIAKISSSVSVAGQIVRTRGSFENSGPIPPRAEQATTYTVVWTAYNTSNNISGVRVESVLPPYVKWLGRTSPGSEDISYSQTDGRLVWNVGNMRSGSGSTGTGNNSNSNRREVSFQISFEPSVSQVGQTPTLVQRAVLSATDDFSGVTLQAEQSDLDTRFESDPAWRSGDGDVGDPKN